MKQKGREEAGTIFSGQRGAEAGRLRLGIGRGLQAVGGAGVEVGDGAC